MPTFDPAKPLATRQASGAVLEAVMPKMPLVWAARRILRRRTIRNSKAAVDFQPATYNGRYIRYGVREHAMGAILNGINLSGLVRAYAGTFFVFADYMRPTIRLAATFKISDDLCIHPRQYRPRRRWANPSAGRTSGVASRNARPCHVPSGRRQRNRSGMEIRPHAQRAGGVRIDTAESADTRRGENGRYLPKARMC